MKFIQMLLPMLLAVTVASGQSVSPQESLNHYIEFLSRSADQIMVRFDMLQVYQDDVQQYRNRRDVTLRLPSSGPPEEFYYTKALHAIGLKPAEKQRLNARAKAIWSVLTHLDATAKALETYVRIQSYEADSLRQSNVYVGEMILTMNQFGHEKNAFYQEIRKIYLAYTTHESGPVHPLHKAEKLMEEVLASQQQVIDSLPFYLDATTRGNLPLNMLSQSILDDQSYVALLKKLPSLPYPASSALSDFMEGVEAMQLLKARAIDAQNYTASLDSKNVNETYLAALKHFNQYLLPMYQSFVGFAVPHRRLLAYPKCSPVIRSSPVLEQGVQGRQTRPFKDSTYQDFQISRAASPASHTTFAVLNQYVDFMNESLRQMHRMQLMLRNYQHSAAPYRDPAYAAHRLSLSFLPRDFNIPSSGFTLLANASSSLPQPYRSALMVQAQVLMNMLKEMEELGAELMQYTAGKVYSKDKLKRSDEILDRYVILFELFDEKKERLYIDLRRICASYPSPAPKTAWTVAGAGLLDLLDEDKRALFMVRDYMKGKTEELPPASRMTESARQLLAKEYTYLTGLQRYGRSNGLCPYSPFEDLAENSIKFAEKTKKALRPSADYGPHPYESFFYFYNNELVYQYNKFVELAKTGLLRAVNQPDLYAFVREKPSEKLSATPELPSIATQRTPQPKTVPDTIPAYLDTIIINQPSARISKTLHGFAPNHMVLLLDVSNSMDSPEKLPLLKRTIKSMLTLVRKEDYISIVLYSGWAHVALQPTSGSRASEITALIDRLRPGGVTHAEYGLNFAYALANEHFIPNGNNRVVLATDGKFPLTDDLMTLIASKAQEKIRLSVFAFGKNLRNTRGLRKIARVGNGNFLHVSEATADLGLIAEAQNRSLLP